MSRRTDQHHVLAVCTEWDSGRGGITTFNRQLCLALAQQGAEVVCLVVAATEVETRQAERAGVTLIDAQANGEPTEALALARKPALPAGFSPTIIIGYSRLTGPSAKALHEDHFPEARRLHIVHMSPDEIEWHKLDRVDDASTRAEARAEEELRLSRTAHRVVAVGPRIFHRLQNDLAPVEITPLQLEPGFDGDGADRAVKLTPAGLCRILLFGRLEDHNLKGLDIAAQAMGQALRWRGGRPGPEIEFVVRGAPASAGAKLRERVQEWAQLPSLNVVVRPYTAHVERLSADLRRASLVLMPSRAEGFGLVGVEAITAGTPALISSTSGLGMLLDGMLAPDDAQRIAVEMAGNGDDLIDRWARAIDAVLRDRDAAFRRAAETRSQLATRKTWAEAAQKLLGSVEPPDRPEPTPGVFSVTEEQRNSLVVQLAAAGPVALSKAYSLVDPNAAAPDWNDLRAATLALEQLPAAPGELPRLFIFVEQVAHQRDRSEFKALHEWLDQAGSAAGLDQEGLRFICLQARQRYSAIGPERLVENRTLAGEINPPNGDLVSETTPVLETVPPGRGVIDNRQHIRGNIPIRNPDFTGREDLLDSLRRTLVESSKASVLPRALHGLGGVGKTQLALEYVYRYADQYDLIWWIPAEQKSLALTSLANLCDELGLTQNLDQQQTADAVLRALSNSSMSWLLVFNNADNPDDILPLVPSAGGHVIITSRNEEWKRSSKTIEVNVFARAESVALLRTRSDDISVDDADRLAATLGDLPLALDQARYWQAATGMRVDEYLDLFDTHARELMSEGKPPWYPTTVAAFVSLAFERLRNANPALAQLLELFAFLGAEPLSVGMLRRAREAAISDPLLPVIREPIRLSRTIRDLRKYGLAKVDADQRIQVHRLVQLVLREELSPELLEKSQENVQRIFAAANPAQPDDTRRYGQVYQEIGPHVLAADLVNSQIDGARQVVLDQIRYLWVIGDYEGSRRLGELAADTWSVATGEGVGLEGELTLLAKRHLANALRDLGERERARRLDEEVYRSLEASPYFGPEHEHTLAAAMSVAVDLRVAGKYREALAIDELNVARHREVFGDEDEQTLRARSNSAVNQRILGDFAGALAVDEELVDGWRQTVGEDDPRYIFSVVNLALDLNGRGRYAEALESLNRVFTRYRQQLGSGHVLVLGASRALSVALRKTGQYNSALPWAEENFLECESRLGPNHERTLAAAMTFANTLRVNGRLVEAREQAASAIRRYGVTFGTRHPLALAAQSNLAVIYRALGEIREARRIGESVLDDMIQLLGAHHGYTLCAASGVANDRVLAHDTNGARALSVQTLDISREVRGEHHPYTLSCAINAALDLQATGQEANGLALFDATIADFAEVLGASHPETVDAGRFKRAECDIEPPPT
ncbi:tetratricopeptide repeat protein [Actinoplanes sp. LDG1-06]|uniref:Tetratricopeptide repeat protein n=1 Tax=Paractinoplanes ovalisporus TaxID=2810368 RepID=A0ABS2A918_9ACTN|nr:FxSxx-COOH system tetratricopeptide repeat protein [Actinoplanes ovalisporus]MBM2615739.1 tetratricopeptide repeat protein [Actinoplanes ovalisporus]